ncbi:HNH ENDONUCLEASE [Salix koriyanagi]|uniref:HNH ENDONUCLEASE n=1 Tax=Salix koriyanagi TaxID=2511006 RepID=A0A9Q0NIE1_9ROSI|nr:HNH ENDONUCLEASE [Salix koriyanagi]
MRRSKEVGKRQSRPSSPSRPSRSDPSPPRSRKSTLSSSASAVDNLELVPSEKQDPFTSGSELFDEPRSFPYSVKQQCWEKAEKVKGRDPDRWRRDPLGNVVFRKLASQA